MGPAYLNENACYFIDGIKLVRKDGFIDTNFTRPNQVISFFIFLFAVSFILLGAYIYYLRMSEFLGRFLSSFRICYIYIFFSQLMKCFLSCFVLTKKRTWNEDQFTVARGGDTVVDNKLTFSGC